MKRRTKFFLLALLAVAFVAIVAVVIAWRLHPDRERIEPTRLGAGVFLREPDRRNLPSGSPFFVNVASEMGLTDVAATEVCWVDANNDGYWDAYLEREHLYLNQSGTSFQRIDTGFEFPEVTRVVPEHQRPVDPANRKRVRLLPTYVYFADLNNDGNVDAIHGIRSDWEFNDGGGWRTDPRCDHGHRNTIYFGTGTGRFAKRESTRNSFDDPSRFGPTFALAIADFDNDGCLDLFDGQSYRRYGVIDNCGQDQLWLGDGTGRFSNATKDLGMTTLSRPRALDSSRPTYGATHGDINNDGYQDILQLAYGRQWNMHWRNFKGERFENVASLDHFDGDECRHGRYPQWWIDDDTRGPRRPFQPELPFRSNGNTMDAAVADYDNDGDLDVFLGEIKHAWAGPSSDLSSLLINRGADGDFIFDRITAAGILPLRESYTHDLRKINFGDLHCAWLDFDNDGWLDLLIASGDYDDGQFMRLYRQLPDQRFVEATELAGFNWEGCGGLSIGDFDRDGDVDILVGRSFARLSAEHREQHMPGVERVVGLFQNRIGDRSNHSWLNVRLVGKGKGASNRYGIGARVSVTTSDGMTQLREIRCGSGMSGHQDPPELHFGLGKHQTIERIVVRWANQDQSEQVLKNVEVNQFLQIREE